MIDLYIALKSLYDATGESVFKATHDKTTAQILAAAVAFRAYSVGGLHLGKAPHGTALPLTTMAPTASAMSGSMGIRYIDGLIITFTIWAPRYGLNAGLAALENLKMIYDNQLVQFATSGGTILCVRQGSGVWYELPEPEGGFGIPVDYKYQFKK